MSDFNKAKSVAARIVREYGCASDSDQTQVDAHIAEVTKIIESVYGAEWGMTLDPPISMRAEEVPEFLRGMAGIPAAPQSDQPAQGERKQIEILRRWLFTVGVDEQSKRAEQLMALLKREGIVAAPASQPVAPEKCPRCGLFVERFPVYKLEMDAWDRAATPSSGADARELAEKLHKGTGCGSDWIPWAVALLESFRAATYAEGHAAAVKMLGENGFAQRIRAETLAHMLELLNSHRLLSSKLGDECSCGKWNADYHDRDRDVWQAWLQHIRALSPDPNWLARQIAEAELEEAKQWHAILRKEVPHVEGDTFECCALISALESQQVKLAPTSKKE